jgi:uncharacterized protein YjeT (DUF2065 family)
MSIVSKILLRIIGLFMVIGAVVAVWFGFERIEEARGLEQNIYTQRSQNVRRSPGAKEAGLNKITEFERDIEAKKVERNLWLGGALVALVAGLGLALGPTSRKRKISVATPTPSSEPGPTQVEDAPGT